MKYVITFVLLTVGLNAFAQSPIWSHAIGNWRNGPVVYITPLIETTTQFTTPMLLERYKAEFPELKDVEDIDILRFGTPEEGDESRLTLQAKYGVRKLEVVMLKAANEQPGTMPTEQH